MSSDQRGVTAEDLYHAMLSALRDGGDAKLCRALDMLAGDTRQNKYRHAGAVIGSTTLGRRAIDDHQALRRIAAFPPARRHAAVGIVARQAAGPAASKKKIDAIAHRLREKLRKNAEELVISATPICDKGR
jgi:hypothetical protein